MVRKGLGVGVMYSFGALDLKTEMKMLEDSYFTAKCLIISILLSSDSLH